MKYILPRVVRTAALLLLSAVCIALPAQAQNTLVRLQTTQGVMDFKLLDTEAPVTVANFLLYVRGGDYADAFFHRSAWLNSTTPFVIQSGGYRWLDGPNGGIYAVTSRGTIVNEFSATRSNARGTVAMAKTNAGPNTATSQWFVNIGNNAAILGDDNNGGFTVFARVTTPGMVVADAISNLPRVDAGIPLDELPVTTLPTNGQVFRNTVVRILAATEVPSVATSDRIFNWLEAAYTQFVMPMPTAAGDAFGYTYRYYGPSDSYLGVKDGRVLYYCAALGMTAPYDIGSVTELLAAAQAAGY